MNRFIKNFKSLENKDKITFWFSLLMLTLGYWLWKQLGFTVIWILISPTFYFISILFKISRSNKKKSKFF